MSMPTEARPAAWRTHMTKWWQRVRRLAPFTAGLLAAFGGLLLYNRLFPPPVPLTTEEIQDTVARAMASATPPASFARAVYESIRPSLVVIEAQMPAGAEEDPSRLGSGVVIDSAGDILTSLHVVLGAETVTVTFADGSYSEASIVIEQPENDIAVLQALQPPPDVIPATLGNPNDMHVGDEAFAVGNPFGLADSMSAGVISGLNRTYTLPGSDQVLSGLIQIDAAVNPGNSGGPLLDRQGYVVGIVTGIVNPTDQGFFVGIGFAVPIEVAASGVGVPRY